MNTYLYNGPTTGITFRGRGGENVEVMLFSGKEVSLPDCAEVSTLVALKRLQPVKAVAAPTPAQSSAPATAAATQAPDTATTATGAAGSTSPAPAATDASSSGASPSAPATQKKGA